MCVLLSLSLSLSLEFLFNIFTHTQEPHIVIDEGEEEKENVITNTFCCYACLQILDVDRDGLTKLKKAVKALHASGNGKF